MLRSIDRPRVAVGHLPTPIDSLDRLSEHLGGPQILMKRDDCTGFALGGNKVRKLEYLVGEALQQGCDTLVTIGGVQSNHCRQTAAAAARFGLKCLLALTKGAVDDDCFAKNGNVLLDRLAGSELHFVGDVQDKAGALAAAADRVREAGGKPYAIALGGSSAVGSLGYVSAALELRDQIDLEAVRSVIVTTGSAGTHAGLCVGLSAVAPGLQLTGVSCSAPAPVLQERISGLSGQIRALLGMEGPQPKPGVHLNDQHIGGGYGHLTEDAVEAIRLCATLEGIYLDPVYTGKAMAGLIAMIRAGRFEKSDKVLFFHTGGTPALFAYRTELERSGHHPYQKT